MSTAQTTVVQRAPGSLAANRSMPANAAPGLGSPNSSARHALPYVLFHHEWWDGGGYPTGMKRRCIPVEARLIAVADAFDAMTSARPYRHALTNGRALQEVERCSGTQFDPEIAELFCAVWSSQPVAAAS